MTVIDALLIEDVEARSRAKAAAVEPGRASKAPPLP
jgi:hypothetical protein